MGIEDFQKRSETLFQRIPVAAALGMYFELP